MFERLEIRNFGPIKSASIDIKELTIFVGPQATGKSLATQLLYFMRQIENLLAWKGDDRFFDSDNSAEEVKQLLSWWIGNNAINYFRKDTSIIWQKKDSSSEKEYSIDKNFQPNDQLAAKIKESSNFSWERQKATPAILNSDVYIPAGRSLYSFMPPSRVLRILSTSSQDWPGYIYIFYEMLGEAINNLLAEEMADMWAGSSIYYDSVKILSDYIQPRIDEILKGRVRYSKSGSVAFEINEKMFLPTAIASGQMEVWPFITILQSHLSRPERHHYGPLRIYFEEPEAHLHPAAQKTLIEIIIASNATQYEQYVITTHSPYVLYTINNALLRSKIPKSDQEKEDLMEWPYALKHMMSSVNASQISAYSFTPDNNVLDILDSETGLIDEFELDRVAESLGADFTEIQESLLK